jgi:hypothetical protein
MTGKEMKEIFEGLVDDKLDDTLIYHLFNQAKNEIENERDWEYLKELDEAQSISAGSTYLTPYNIPTRYLHTVKLYVGDERVPYDQINLEDRNRFRDSSRRFYLKMKDGKFYICGSPVAGSVISHFYIEGSEDIAEATTWSFPTIGHPLVPIKAAKIFYPIDRVEKTRAYSPEWYEQEKYCRRMLHQWDAKIKKGTHKGDRFTDLSSHPNVIDIDR